MICPGIAAPCIMLDIASAFEKLGHTVFPIDLRTFEQLETNEQKLQFFLDIREELRHFEPHFAVGYNASVFISLRPDQRSCHFFESLNIPYISLFFDNPMLPQYQRAIYTPNSPLYVIFIWDRYYAELFSQKYRRAAHYLPLAANTDIFRPLPAKEHFKCDVAFIGSIPETGNFRQERFSAGWHEWLIQFAENVLAAKQQHPGATIEEIINAFQSSFPVETRRVFSDFMNQEAFSGFLISIYAQFAYQTRMDAVQALDGFRVHVHGGNGWKRLKQPNLTCKGAVSYHEETPEVYNSATINLNITNAQLVTAVNQRVFDVPACNAFLLSDFRSDLSHLFTTGEEVVVFHDMEDMKQKAAYYLDHEEERKEIAARAYQRVIRDHTYIHRVQSIIDVVRALE